MKITDLIDQIASDPAIKSLKAAMARLAEYTELHQRRKAPDDIKVSGYIVLPHYRTRWHPNVVPYKQATRKGKPRNRRYKGH